MPRCRCSTRRRAERQSRHVIASEAKQSIFRQVEIWIASSLPLLAMTAGHIFATLLRGHWIAEHGRR
ncbi:hypothetical protein E3H11_33980 [Bradyrhizobium brasilense]|nr:hypothetical protein [Bradyrhizobium brasilense]